MKKSKKITALLVAVIMLVSLAACATNANDANTKTDTASSTNNSATSFPKFKGTDFKDNPVDESIFSKNDVTVLNFWYNDCPACVNEMPTLEKLNQKLKSKNAELVGINVAAGTDAKTLKDAKDIVSKQGATYKNLALKSGKEINSYINNIYGYPTSVLVDRNGKIIGEPILGAINNEAQMDKILKMVDEAIGGKSETSTKSK